MNKENIILIGMPGSGKSTCGVLTAKVMLKNFFDTDLLLQGMQEKKLQDIIDENGIDYFLSAEEKAVLSLNINATVIATGGSVVYSDEAMKHLKKNGCVVYPKLRNYVQENKQHHHPRRSAQKRKFTQGYVR